MSEQGCCLHGQDVVGEYQGIRELGHNAELHSYRDRCTQDDCQILEAGRKVVGQLASARENRCESPRCRRWKSTS